MAVHTTNPVSGFLVRASLSCFLFIRGANLDYLIIIRFSLSGAEARCIQIKLAEQSAKAEDAKKTLQEKEENLMTALKDAEKMLAEADDQC